MRYLKLVFSCWLKCARGNRTPLNLQIIYWRTTGLYSLRLFRFRASWKYSFLTKLTAKKWLHISKIFLTVLLLSLLLTQGNNICTIACNFWLCTTDNSFIYQNKISIVTFSLEILNFFTIIQRSIQNSCWIEGLVSIEIAKHFVRS